MLAASYKFQTILRVQHKFTQSYFSCQRNFSTELNLGTTKKNVKLNTKFSINLKSKFNLTKNQLEFTIVYNTDYLTIKR